MRRLVFFIKLFFWFSARQLRMQPWRVAAVLLGIGLGAAVFTSVRLAVDASLTAFTRSMDLISGRADVSVISRGGRVPEELAGRLLAHPDIEAVSPVISRYVKVPGEDNDPFLLMGLDPILDRKMRAWESAEGGLPERAWLDLIRRPGTLFVSRGLAEAQDLSPGASIALEHVARMQVFEVLGALKSEGIGRIEGGYMALGDIGTVQEFTGLHGWVDRIDIRFGTHAPADAIGRIGALLPPGVEIVSATEAKATGSSMIRAYQVNLSLLSFVSLFVGMFLIYSLVSFNAASRRRELAILRSLGASARQVFMLILFEGAILGALGWLVAIPLGSLLTAHLIGGVNNTVNNLFVRVRSAGLELDALEVLLSFLVTILVSLLAAFRPARQAVLIPPREALSSQAMPAARGPYRFGGLLFGGLMILLAFPLCRFPAVSGVPLAGYGAVLAMVAGFSMLSPPLLHLIGVYLPGPLRRHFGEPAFLAARYVRDARDRTAISVGALITAMALFTALVVMVNSFRDTVSLWVNQTLVGDLFARPKMAGLNQYRDPIPEAVVRYFQDLPEDVELLPYKRLFLTYDRVPYQLEPARLEILLRRGHFLFLEGDQERISGPLIAGGGVIVSEVFANQTGLTVGDRFRTRLGTADFNLPVLGIFRDYRTRGGVVFMALETFMRVTGDGYWGGIIVFFKDRDQDLEA
ncbi:MAG: ABC transporter permease, partial [Deltaproteobacteria bacterium]|nr:ABC transporter permease [Deltaproteobacteria bacterium]